MLEPITARCLLELPGIAHGFFTRAGGVSTGLYAALNCGHGSKDTRFAVAENRSRVAGHLGTVGARLLTVHQIHSARTVVATAPWSRETMPQADAIVTREPGIAVGALAADCAPVLFADPEAGVVAAAHAGWRGALAGIVEATVQSMERLGAVRSRIRGALGPCISAAAYEVGPEFEREFLAHDPAYDRFFVRSRPAERPRFDLTAFVMHRLTAAGIATAEHAGACTYGDESRFFSFRRTTHRGEPDYGRQISAILLR